MLNKFGVFVHLDYAHQPVEECKLTWKTIMDMMLANGFSFQKRCFVICTEMKREKLSAKVRDLFEKLHSEQSNLYSYIADCFILDLKDCRDLTLPDTSDSIDVKHVSIDDMDVLDIEPNLFLSKP